MSQESSEIATGGNSCSGKDPLISIAIALWMCVIAFVLLIYLYWRHIHLKPRHNSEAQDNSYFRKTSDFRVKKELEKSSTEQYECLKGSTDRKRQDVYHTLDTKQEEPSINAKDIQLEGALCNSTQSDI